MVFSFFFSRPSLSFYLFRFLSDRRERESDRKKREGRKSFGKSVRKARIKLTLFKFQKLEKKIGRNRPPGRQLLGRVRRAGQVPPDRLPQKHRDQRARDSPQHLQHAKLRVAQLRRAEGVQVRSFDFFFGGGGGDSRSREVRWDEELTCFFLLLQNTLLPSKNRNGQGLVNGVGYSAADWSVTDTFSLAVFSKVREVFSFVSFLSS